MRKFASTVSKMCLSLVVGAGLIPAPSLAMTSQAQEAESLREMLALRLNGATVESISPSGMRGIYEVIAGGRIFYTDSEGRYLLVGNLIDSKSMNNLTAKRMEVVSRMELSAFPLEVAIKQTKGNGEKKIILFEDPNCAFCKQFRKSILSKVENITIYTFMLGLLGPDSEKRQASIVCSENPELSLETWFANGDASTKPTINCGSRLKELSDIASRARIIGTPTIFFEDGSRATGVANLETFLARLNKSEPQVKSAPGG